MTTIPEAHPAATVILLRDGEPGIEVLMVRRNSKLAFHGGAWVFPGGRIDEADYERAGTRDARETARLAAAREAREEAGVDVNPQSLVMLSRWITPENVFKRFDTWFLLGAAADIGAVTIDGHEIQDHAWLQPTQALVAQRQAEIELPPPTFVTLTQLLPFTSTQAAIDAFAAREAEEFRPLLHFLPEGACTVYVGDSAYGSDDLEAPGRRHRLWMIGSEWRYERDL